jgi:hypothetical protein
VTREIVLDVEDGGRIVEIQVEAMKRAETASARVAVTAAAHAV